MPFAADDFDRLFDASDDPWQFRTRWYERRKRDMTLACLPRRRYASAYEPGCANGELSAALATRCERLLVSDGSRRAVDLARQRLAAFRHVEVVQAWLPEQWPDGGFELVVLSELGYFLDAEGLDRLADRAAASLTAHGTVLACHWRHPIEHGSLDGDAVHERLHRRLPLKRMGRWEEQDFLIDVWSRNTRSPAQCEALV